MCTKLTWAYRAFSIPVFPFCLNPEDAVAHCRRVQYLHVCTVLIVSVRVDFRWCGIRIFDQPATAAASYDSGCSRGERDGQTPFLMSRSCERRVGPGCSRTRQVSPGAGSPQTYQMVPGLCQFSHRVALLIYQYRHRVCKFILRLLTLVPSL